MVHGVDHLQVGAGLLLHPGEVAGDARFLEAVFDIAARAAAQNTGGQAARAQGLEHLGHVDALAARVQAKALDAVHLIHGKIRQHHRFVQGGGQRYGYDHAHTSLFD